MTKSSKVLVASIGDWYTEAFARNLKELGHEVEVVIGLTDLIGTMPNRLLFYLEALFYRFGYIYFNNPITILRFQLFDFLVSRIVTKHDSVFLWSGMCKFSIKSAKKKGASVHVFVGNENLMEYYRKCGLTGNVVFKCFIARYWLELEMCDKIFCESEYVKDSFNDNLKQKILNFVPEYETQAVRAELQGVNSESFKIALIGLNDRKGKKELTELVKSSSFKNCEIFVYSGERIITNTNNKIHYVDNLKGMSYINSLKQNDIYINLTKSDGGPRALFEAMSCGLLVVSTMNCAAGEHIRHGETGFLIKNYSEIPQILHYLDGHRSHMLEIRGNCLNYVKDVLTGDNRLSLQHLLNNAVGL